MDHPYDIYREEVKEALRCKLDEFALLDFTEVTEDDLWEMLTKKRWKKPQEDIHIYQIVSDIMSVKPSDMMNFISALEMTAENLFSEENREELRELLK
ncbi:MAG: post-transcriptional regulator [Caldibacillus debilis]|jgi:hypothetical protein|uniref:Post-transcriptional regulator n=1 Tax=Caldibacillus debilis TaxID=301148 RepID=A0A3E0K0L7_9BACI|nr:post-transcriptional regulator [Caldibacillus debilis]MBO2480860.1 post-transcriptional regulator [Bacillaceae bacterium]MBY6270622.1 post-transcriptional regulator [Bacillaceae bacterium]OUM84194.1 MAG: post-transcriptional regulator [Caldibacillus debilis]REJ26261.1 MAG: post-transcriptional regulator [Caldibacillus debilis]